MPILSAGRSQSNPCYYPKLTRRQAASVLSTIPHRAKKTSCQAWTTYVKYPWSRLVIWYIGCRKAITSKPLHNLIHIYHLFVKFISENGCSWKSVEILDTGNGVTRRTWIPNLWIHVKCSAIWATKPDSPYSMKCLCLNSMTMIKSESWHIDWYTL